MPSHSSEYAAFVADVAHDLRTPLAILKANTEVALLENGLDARLRQMLRSNIEEIDRISRTLNDLLAKYKKTGTD